MKFYNKRINLPTLGAFLLVGIVIVVIGLYFGLKKNDEPLNPPDVVEPLPPSSSYMGVYLNASVAANGPPCAEIGRDILLRGGSAVEAAIATLFCDGVVNMQSMGLGGGFFMVIYQNGTSYSLNARERAPGNSSRDMFKGNSSLSQFGGMSVAVPGELKGYWEAFQKFKSNNVEWRDLVQPTIDMCENGFSVPESLSLKLKGSEKDIIKSSTLSNILINKKTNKIWQQGDVITLPDLAKFLRRIQDGQNAIDSFYGGELGQMFIDDVRSEGGIMTIKDLKEYYVVWNETLKADFHNISMYTVPPPGSGALLSFMCNILDGFIPSDNDAVTYHRIIETFKYAYGRRTELGDPEIVDIKELLANLTSKEYARTIRKQILDDRTWQDPEHYGAVFAPLSDHGTAHVSVLAPNGDAVSVTSTINLSFGSKVVSRKTGIIMNNEMDDFSAPHIVNAFGLPPSPANFIKPGKRPLSSMSPAIFVDKEGVVRLVVGAAGGSKITSATALVAINNIIFNKSIKQSLDEARIHHQLYPMRIMYEYGVLKDIVQDLKNIGHKMSRDYSSSSTSANAISREGSLIFANSDFRRGGTTAGF